MGEEDFLEKKEAAAPFNFAIATLMRINDILKDITSIEKRTGILNEQNLEKRLPDGLSLNIKYKLVWQLFTQATPLLKETQQTKIETELEKIKPKNQIGNNQTAEDIQYQIFSYSLKTDLELNKIMILIQKSLQSNGSFFMPNKEDPRFALLNK